MGVRKLERLMPNGWSSGMERKVPAELKVKGCRGVEGRRFMR